MDLNKRKLSGAIRVAPKLSTSTKMYFQINYITQNERGRLQLKGKEFRVGMDFKKEVLEAHENNCRILNQLKEDGNYSRYTDAYNETMCLVALYYLECIHHTNNPLIGSIPCYSCVKVVTFNTKDMSLSYVQDSKEYKALRNSK